MLNLLCEASYYIYHWLYLKNNIHDFVPLKRHEIVAITEHRTGVATSPYCDAPRCAHNSHNLLMEDDEADGIHDAMSLRCFCIGGLRVN